MSILSGSQRPTEIQVSPSMALACSQRWLPPSTCNSKGEVSSPSIQPPPPVVPTLATTADVQSSSSLLPSALSTTACSPTNSPVNTRFLAPPQEIAECKQPVVSQLMGHQSSSRFTSHHLPNSPTINETSQPAGSEAPFQESPSQISFHESPSQSISCSHLWDTRTSDTPNSPAPTTATSTIRPFRMRRLVRTLFEAAALEYASALRTALLFPSATSSITTATTTPSCDTSPTTQKHLNQGRWKAKCGNESIQRPTQPVKPIFHPVPTSPPPTPVPPTWAAPRSWEQGDSIAQDIQEIRCQFDPVTPSLSHQQQRSLSHQPRASLSIPTPTPGRRYTKCAVTPCKNAQISGRTRHARPLFRGGRRRDQWTTQEVDEEDEWIDVEEVSPPRTTYHLYRMGADGTKCTLPITVMSTDRTPVMSQLPITPSSPSRRPVTTLTPSQGPITTLTPSQRPVTTPTLSHRAITTLTPSNRPTLSLQMIRDRRSVVQRQPLPHKSTTQHQRYSTVSRPSSIHHQDRAPTGTSQRHVVSGSSYSKLTVLKIPVTRTQQSKMTVNKEALGHERDVLAQKVVVGPDRDTDGDDVQVIPNTQPVTSHFIILSSDSSPEPIEKEDPIGTSSGKEESYRNSTSKHVSNETFSGRKDNLMQKVSSDKNADVMNVLILSDDDDELPDLNRSLPPASPIREKQILEPHKACQSQVGKLEVRCDDTKKDTAVTDSNYLSDASTIIFEDDFDVDMLEENSKDKFSGDECKNAEAFHKTIKTAGNTAAHASALSADELPQRDNKKTEVPNFKLLQTSSDEPESSPMMETGELEIIRSTDKKQVDTVLINKIHTLRLVFSDFIHLNTFPCPLKHSQTNVVDKHQESADGDTRNQFSEFGKTKFADNIKIRDDESTEILGQPRKHDNYVVSRGLEQYRQGRESSLEHKDAVRLLKEDSLNMPESLNVTLQGRISSEAKARDLAKGNSTNENNADYCEFTDVSSIIFVSDGQLIFPVHVLSVSQQQRMQVSPAEEVGIIHQCVYSGRACDAGAALSGNIEMSDSHVSEVRKREISIPENKSLGDDTQTFKKKDVILFKKDGTSRDKMTYGDYKSVQEQKPKEECKLIQKYKTFKETCNSEIEKDPVQGTKVNILINDGSLNESKASKSSPTHFENKSISSSYNEQTLTTTLTDVTCKNSFETCETPSVDNLKEQLDSTKEIVRSLNNVLEVQKISESQESQNPSLEKEELLKSKLENDGLERKETTNLQKPQVSGMKSQEKPDPHILQNDVLVDHSLSESLRVTHQPVPESLCVAEKNTRAKYQVVEMQERLEKPGVKKNQGTSVSPSQPKVVLENMDLLRCETSARGSTLLTTSEDGVAKHEELDTVSASTEIKTQPLWYQRYRSSIIQGLVEELRIMGEREMKFTLEERTTFTKEKDSGDNDKSRKIIMKEGRKMEESTSVVLSEGNIKERTVNVLDEGKINECITVVLNEGKRDDCTAVLDERNMKDCAVNVLEEGEIKECITIVLNKGKMEECTTIVSNDWKKTEEGQTKLLQLKTYESELRGKSSILPQMNGKLFFIPQMNRKSPIVSQLNEDKEKQRKSIPYLKPIVTNTIKMATIGSIDKKCDITEKEPHTVHVLTKNNVVEQEVEFIRKVNVAHTQTADIQSERDRIDKNGLPLAFKGQYNESATNVSEMTELPVTAVKTDNEREKKCKKNENEASDQRISQVRELENVQNTVDGKDNNDVRLPAIQKETIINKNEDQSDDGKYCSRVSKLKDNETRDCSIPRSYQTEESSRRINKVGDKPAMNEYQFKTIDVYVKDIAGESKTITPGQLLQSEKMIENSKTSVKEKTGENENERENEDTTSKVQGASPEGPLRVSSRLVTVKHDSVATSVSPSQSSISSLSDFVKRISQKIDQLKVKTKSTVMDAERYQHSHKRLREFDSTLEDFITKHRQAEEGKQAVHKRVLSPVSSEARKINSCGKPNDVGKSEVYSSRCKQETRYIEDAKRCEEDDKSNTLLSASVPSHPSDTESSNSNAQQHSSDCQISASDIKQSVHSQQLLRSGTLPSQNNTQPSTSNESSSANGVRPVDIDAEVTQTKKDDKDFGTTENSGKEGGSTTITCSEISNKISSGNDATVTTPNKSTTTTNSDTIVNTTNSSSTTDSNITQTTSNNTVNISNSTATVTVVTSSASGSTGRARKRRREKGTIHYILEVSLNEVYKKCVDVVRSFGEKMVSSLRSKEVVGHNHSFSTLQPDYTRSLLNQIVRTRKGPYQPSSEEDKLYRRLLTLHGLVKAADLFCHYGFRPAIHCLQQFQICHQALIPGCYNKVLAGLQELEEGADLTHPKVRALQEEMARARHRGDPNDAETKVLVVARRESQWVREQLGEALGADTVALLSNKQGYHQVLKLLESRSVVVWSEDEGEEEEASLCSSYRAHSSAWWWSGRLLHHHPPPVSTTAPDRTSL
nr:uncharacterized protein LOC128701519 [Cherax quadricarinatus]